MRIRSILAVVAFFGLAQAAMAAPAFEEAYEVAVSDLTLPTNEFGSVILRQCDQCDLVTLRVDGTTQYYFEGQPLTLKEFRASVLNARNKDSVAATVIYRLEDERVVRIHVAAAPGADGRG